MQFKSASKGKVNAPVSVLVKPSIQMNEILSEIIYPTIRSNNLFIETVGRVNDHYLSFEEPQGIDGEISLAGMF